MQNLAKNIGKKFKIILKPSFIPINFCMKAKILIIFLWQGKILLSETVLRTIAISLSTKQTVSHGAVSRVYGM